MKTIAETRRLRLEELITQHGGKLADLNQALGYERTEAKLARIRNANERKDRPGKTFQMGDPQAREIEEKLSLPRGWMDTPPGFEGADDPAVQQMLALLRKLAPEERAKAMRLLGAFAEPTEPHVPNGTTG